MILLSIRRDKNDTKHATRLLFSSKSPTKHLSPNSAIFNLSSRMTCLGMSPPSPPPWVYVRGWEELGHLKVYRIPQAGLGTLENT